MKKIFKLIIGVVLLLVLVIGGFALGVYLQLFDTSALNEELGLYDLPVVGRFFVQPDRAHTEQETEATPPEPDKKDAAKESTTRRLTPEDIEKERKARQAEEKKRVKKLARVYDQMKPKDAAEVMGSLEDGLAVQILQSMDEGQAAKVLAAMDAGRSAQLTKLLYTGLVPGTGAARGTAGTAVDDGSGPPPQP